MAYASYVIGNMVFSIVLCLITFPLMSVKCYCATCIIINLV